MNVIKQGVMNALGVILYIIILVTLMFNLSSSNIEDTILAPIVMLMLLVFSAAFTGSLVFGLPILWYLDGKKKESLKLLMYTLGTLLLIILLVFLVIILFS